MISTPNDGPFAGPDSLAPTEDLDPRYEELDAWPVPVVLDALLESQLAAAAAVRAARPSLERAVEAALPRLKAGGRLVYAGAGTSGRIAFQDGAELPPTFDWPQTKLAFLMAGGTDALVRAAEGAEDRGDVAEAEVAALRLGPHDVLLALAASGTTPYTRAAVQAARARGCLTVGIANNPSAPLLSDAEIPVLVETGPEAVSGSTRLKAGTAQKIVLNLLSTALMIRLGRVYRGQMVDMRATNAKLRVRAERMLARLTNGSPEEIRRALLLAEGNVKLGVLILHGLDRAQADSMLAQHGGHLRSILAAITSGS